MFESAGQVTIDLFFHKKGYLMLRNHLDAAQGNYFTYMIPLLSPLFFVNQISKPLLGISKLHTSNIRIIDLLNIHQINGQLIIQIVSSHILISFNLPIPMSP